MKMKVTKDQIRAHLKKMWKKDGACSVCGSNSWQVVDEEFCLTNEDMSIRLPICVITCEKCGFVHLLSAEPIRAKLV